MGSFPQQFFSVTITSLCISGIGMVFGGLATDLSPIVWLIPLVIALTFIYNTYILLTGSSESYNSPRLYSALTVGVAYFLTFLWTISLAASITMTCLLLTNIINTPDENIKIWMPIVSGVSLLQSVLLGFMAVRSHQEMKQIRYKNKWKWRIDIQGVNNSQWRLVVAISLILLVLTRSAQ
ncbi:hypothetical protein JR316_0001856 [Psilocybe cubensis]|uniref:Uncharacterized protein n=2 Tax=Psilocybe cubensis TaxID=181762 RepID=A0A8H7Y2J1_PSICU|nr:hypothetical protein JR316_0001856 [Psilocybe cubensis]KAH9484952.1 hypothetical protein JR316_0001856 [Psilocybe cubensis]